MDGEISITIYTLNPSTCLFEGPRRTLK